MLCPQVTRTIQRTGPIKRESQNITAFGRLNVGAMLTLRARTGATVGNGLRSSVKKTM